jgi:hypothetical protein
VGGGELGRDDGACLWLAFPGSANLDKWHSVTLKKVKHVKENLLDVYCAETEYSTGAKTSVLSASSAGNRCALTSRRNVPGSGRVMGRTTLGGSWTAPREKAGARHARRGYRERGPPSTLDGGALPEVVIPVEPTMGFC